MARSSWVGSAAVSGVDVSPVQSRRDLRAFVDLPFRLHANAEQWVPPLRIERRLFLSRRFNAFFEHADAQLFLARRGDRVVGRVSAQIDHAFNDYHDNRWGMFGFLELEEDQEVMRALLDAAAAWLAERGRDRMVGPMDFTMNDESGVLIEGHDRAPMIKQPWQPPYYQRLCEAAGLQKAVDLLMWELDIEDRASGRARHGGAGRAPGGRSRSAHPADVAPAPAARAGSLRRDLQRGMEGQLGLRPLLEARPRPLRPGAAAGVRPQLVHDRREDGHRRERGRGDHGAGHQPGAEEDGWPIAALRVVALPVRAAQDHQGASRLSRGQAGLPAHRGGRRALHRALRHGRAHAPEGRRDGLDPRDQRRHEPRHGGNGRLAGQALQGLRAAARG